MQAKKQQLELDLGQQTGSKSGKQYVKAVYCHPAYLTYIQVSCIVVRCFTVWTTSESLYADYIMKNSGQDEAQARIKIA